VCLHTSFRKITPFHPTPRPALPPPALRWKPSSADLSQLPRVSHPNSLRENFGTLKRDRPRFGRIVLTDGRTDGRAIVGDTRHTEGAATLRVPQNHDPHWYAIER